MEGILVKAQRIIPLMARGWVGLVALSLAIGLAGDAWAFRKPDVPDRLPAAALPKEKPPGVWTHQQAVPMTLPGQPRSDAGIVKALTGILASHPEWTGGLPVQALRLDRIDRVPANQGLPEMVYVRFVQQLQGLEVEDAQFVCVLKLLKDETALMASHGHVYPKATLPARQNLSDTTLRAIAMQRAQLAPEKAQIRRERRKAKWIKGTWRRVREVSFEDKEEAALIDEATGEGWEVSERMYVISGQARGRGRMFGPYSSLTTLTLGKLKVDAVPTMYTGPYSASVYANGSGGFSFPTSQQWVFLSAYLQGRYANVRNVAGAELSVSAFTQNGSPVTLLFNSSNGTGGNAAQVQGYYHTNFIHDWVGGSLGAVFPNPWYGPLKVKVNVTGSCNAYYSLSAQDINFFNAGNNCPNMAYDTVIYHEYGHFVDHMVGGITSGGLSEGWGDVFASYATGQPLIGEDFFGPGTALRTAANTYRYNADDEIHDQGQAWAGFAWDLRQSLGPSLATWLVIPSLYANASNISNAVYQVLLRDDNDGNLWNGTPHGAQIVQAAANHGISP